MSLHFNQLTNQPKPNKNKKLEIFYINIISLSLATAIKQTPELELYEVVRPKKLYILHKRETQNNQTEKHGKEVSDVNDWDFTIIWREY